MVKLKILGSSTSQPNQIEIAQVDPFINAETVTINKELDGQQSLLFRGTLTPQGTTNLPPVINTNIGITGKVNQEVTLTANITDPDGMLESVNWTQISGPGVIITKTEQPPTYTAKFTPTVAETYVVRIEATDTQNGRSSKDIVINIDQSIPTGTVNVSAKWSNGHSRSFTGFDPDDGKVEVRANGSTQCVIDGKGNCTITGDRRRIYCYYNNYNARLTVTLIPNFSGSGDNCSLKMRSRHNEPGQTCSGGSPLDGNRFGGYGFAVKKSSWDSKREPTHNCHDESKNGSIPKALVNGQAVKLRQTIKDEGGKVHQIGEIDYMDGNGFHKVMDIFDDSPKSWMVDKNLYMTKSYFWIRNNGSGSITVRDVSLEVLP